MKPREKILLSIVGAVVLLFPAGLIFNFAFVRPLKKIDKDIAIVRDKLAKINQERLAYFAGEDLVRSAAQRTFSDQVDEASAKSGEMLTRQIILSGLRESEFSRMPVGPRKLPGANEIGWSVQGEGRLINVINLLFLLQHSPYLHRVDNLSISAGDAPGQVRVRFWFSTLVLDPTPSFDPIPLEPKFSLNGPERQLYQPIVTRDILRPYIKRPPPAGASNPNLAEAAAPTLTPGGPESFRVVSLSQWMGQPEIHVRDLANQKTLRFQTGESLAGGTIALIDYRPLPMPGSPGMLSFSRIVLKIGDEYWAIERGKTFADKYRLAPEQVPPELQPK